jgi:hypothetical protein
MKDVHVNLSTFEDLIESFNSLSSMNMIVHDNKMLQSMYVEWTKSHYVESTFKRDWMLNI